MKTMKVKFILKNKEEREENEWIQGWSEKLRGERVLWRVRIMNAWSIQDMEEKNRNCRERLDGAHNETATQEEEHHWWGMKRQAKLHINKSCKS